MCLPVWTVLAVIHLEAVLIGKCDGLVRAEVLGMAGLELVGACSSDGVSTALFWRPSKKVRDIFDFLHQVLRRFGTGPAAKDIEQIASRGRLVLSGITCDLCDDIFNLLVG